MNPNRLPVIDGEAEIGAFIDLAHKLGMAVCAERMENQEGLDRLDNLWLR